MALFTLLPKIVLKDTTQPKNVYSREANNAHLDSRHRWKQRANCCLGSFIPSVRSSHKRSGHSYIGDPCRVHNPPVFVLHTDIGGVIRLGFILFFRAPHLRSTVPHPRADVSENQVSYPDEQPHGPCIQKRRLSKKYWPFRFLFW